MRRSVAATIAPSALVIAGTAYALTPDDPLASHPADAALNLPDAWETTTGSPHVIVAIIDSGVDPTHADLTGAVLPGYDSRCGSSAPVASRR